MANLGNHLHAIINTPVQTNQLSIPPDLKEYEALEALLAGITGLTFHDLRHCATTKMVNAGLPAEHIMAATGHTQSSTFRRYINTDVERVQSIAEALDAMQGKDADKPLTSQFTN